MSLYTLGQRVADYFTGASLRKFYDGEIEFYGQRNEPGMVESLKKARRLHIRTTAQAPNGLDVLALTVLGLGTFINDLGDIIPIGVSLLVGSEVSRYAARRMSKRIQAGAVEAHQNLQNLYDLRATLEDKLMLSMSLSDMRQSGGKSAIH